MYKYLEKDKEFKLWWLFNRTRDVMFKVRTRELRKADLSVRQSGALLIIKVLGGRAILADIARWMFKEPHSVSGLINRMEEEGLVKEGQGPGKEEPGESRDNRERTTGVRVLGKKRGASSRNVLVV